MANARALTVATLALSLCLMGPTVASATEADMEEIRRIGAQWQALYAAEDYDAIPELYTEDALVMPRGRPAIEGRAALRRALGGLAAGRKVAIQIVERELRLLGDHAWLVGAFRVSYGDGEKHSATTEYGRSLIIFRRDDDGRWRIHRDIDSPAPIPETWPPQ